MKEKCIKFLHELFGYYYKKYTMNFHFFNVRNNFLKKKTDNQNNNIILTLIYFDLKTHSQ